MAFDAWTFIKDFGGPIVSVLGWPVAAWIANRGRSRLKTDLEIAKLLRELESDLAPQVLAVVEQRVTAAYLSEPWPFSIGGMIGSLIQLVSAAFSFSGAVSAIRHHGPTWIAVLNIVGGFASIFLMLYLWRQSASFDRELDGLKKIETDLSTELAALRKEMPGLRLEAEAIELELAALAPYEISPKATELRERSRRAHREIDRVEARTARIVELERQLNEQAKHFKRRWVVRFAVWTMPKIRRLRAWWSS